MMARRKAPGLYLRKGRYYLAWYLPGHGMQHVALIPTGDTKATNRLEVAEVLRAQILSAGLTAKQITAARRRAPQGQSRTRQDAERKLPPKVEELLSHFEKHNRDHASAEHVHRNAKKVRAFLTELGISDMATIAPAAVEAHLASQRSRELSASTRAKTRAALSCFCRFLVVRGILSHNPVAVVRGPKITLPPPRFLTPEEYEQACDLARSVGIWPEVATALWTGMRLGEIRQLTWDMIDWTGRKIVLLESKTDRPRAIPMKQDLAPVLEDHARTTMGQEHPVSGLVFHDGKGAPRSDYRWRHALDPLRARMSVFGEVKGTGAGWHRFRHTFASRLVQAGVPLRRVAEWLGHSSLATTMRYAHLQPAHDAQVEHA